MNMINAYGYRHLGQNLSFRFHSDQSTMIFNEEKETVRLDLPSVSMKNIPFDQIE